MKRAYARQVPPPPHSALRYLIPTNTRPKPAPFPPDDRPPNKLPPPAPAHSLPLPSSTQATPASLASDLSAFFFFLQSQRYGTRPLLHGLR